MTTWFSAWLCTWVVESPYACWNWRNHSRWLFCIPRIVHSLVVPQFPFRSRIESMFAWWILIPAAMVIDDCQLQRAPWNNFLELWNVWLWLIEQCVMSTNKRVMMALWCTMKLSLSYKEAWIWSAGNFQVAFLKASLDTTCHNVCAHPVWKSIKLFSLTSVTSWHCILSVSVVNPFKTVFVLLGLSFCICIMARAQMISLNNRLLFDNVKILINCLPFWIN